MVFFGYISNFGAAVADIPNAMVAQLQSQSVYLMAEPKGL